MAGWLANDALHFRGDNAVAAGWLERGRSLLDGRPPSAEYGWLLVIEGYFALLTLVAQGCSDAKIAERVVVSPHTVHRHVANVRTKLRRLSRAAAVAYATREGLL